MLHSLIFYYLKHVCSTSMLSLNKFTLMYTRHTNSRSVNENSYSGSLRLNVEEKKCEGGSRLVQPYETNGISRANQCEPVHRGIPPHFPLVQRKSLNFAFCNESGGKLTKLLVQQSPNLPDWARHP